MGPKNMSALGPKNLNPALQGTRIALHRKQRQRQQRLGPDLDDQNTRQDLKDPRANYTNNSNTHGYA